MENKKNTLINIVIPAYLPTQNHVNFLRDSIDSVYNQTIDDWICTVVVNGENSIEDFQYDDRFECLHMPYKTSAAVARNIGASQNFDCEYVCFLDADDLFLPNKIEKQLSAFESDDDLEFCFTRASKINFCGDDMGSYIMENQNAIKTEQIRNIIAQENVMICSSQMLKLDSFIKCGMFLPVNEYKIKGCSPHINDNGYACEDYEFFVNALNCNYNFLILEDELVKYRVGSSVDR